MPQRRGKGGADDEVAKENLDSVLDLLPALQEPTISALSDPDWVDVITILEESVVRNIVPQLKTLGATGIIEYPISKLID